MRTARLMPPVPTLALVIALAPLTGATAAASDWPQFRGPDASGIAPELELTPPLSADRQIRWRADLPGRGLSAPVIVGNRLVLTAADGREQSLLHVLCFDVRTGQPLWKRSFWATGRTMSHEKTCVAAPTPAADDHRIVALFSSNDLICLDWEGRLQWLRGLTVDHPNASNSLGMSSSPILAGDTAIVQIENDSESFAAGIHLSDGSTRWRIERPKASNWTSPLPLPQAGTAALQSSQGVTVVNTSSGRALWEYTDGASTIPSGAASGDLLIIPSHGLTALTLNSDAGGDRMVWRSGALRPGTASPIIVGDRVYILNNAGILACGALETGARLWQLRLKGPFSATPVASGLRLWTVNEAGLVQAVDIVDGESGRVTGELDLGETILGTPAAADGALFLRSDRSLWRLQDS